MSDRIRQVLAYVIAVGMVIAVAAAPTVAQETDPNAERVFKTAGLNADKVDGKHAVKYTTNKVKRAGKLVATNANGVLPSNIVKPQWRVIQNMPAGFADGTDDVGYTSTVHDTYVIDDSAASVSVDYVDSLAVDAELIPVNVGDEVLIIEETFKRTTAKDIRHYYRVKRHPNSANATVRFKVRIRVYDNGIAKLSGLSRKAIKDLVTVKLVKGR